MDEIDTCITYGSIWVKGFLFTKRSKPQFDNKCREKLIICLSLMHLAKLVIFVISTEVHEMEKLWFNRNRSLNRGLCYIIQVKCRQTDRQTYIGTHPQ